MIYSFVVIIIYPPVQAPSPTVGEQPIVQEQPLAIEPERGSINWHCPHCGWWNAYDNMASYRIGSKAHLRNCPKR